VQSILDSEKIKDFTTEQEWILKKKIPRGVFGEVALNDITAESAVIFNLISDAFGGKSVAYQEKVEVSLSEDSHSWTLRSKLDWHQVMADGTHRLFSVKSGSVSNTDFTKLFLDALLIAAAKQDPDSVTPFELRIFSSKNEVVKKEFVINRNDAVLRLKQIYHRCFVENYRKCVPAKMYDERDVQTFVSYRTKLAGKFGAWSYFDGKNLFDPERFSGFSRENFLNDWNDAVSEQVRLLDPIWSEEDE
jgi:hypothetical protein